MIRPTPTLWLLWLSALLFLFAPEPALRAQDDTAALPATFRVATRIIPPFVLESNGKLDGFSIELWRTLASRLHVKSQMSVAPSVKGLLSAVGVGKADLGISAVSITADRDRTFDFSQPIYDSGLQIMVRGESKGNRPLASILSVLLSPTMLQFAGIILLMILLPAPLIWLVERRHPEGMIARGRFPQGLFKAGFWAASTLATQADEMPKSPIGRVIAVIWMFVSVVFVAYFTAAVTSSLTVQQLKGDIRGPEDLPGKRVATTTGSTSAVYLKEQHCQVQEVADITRAYDALLANDVDAVVFDSPVLLYYAAHEGKGKVQVIGSVFRKESYGIVFPQDSPYRKPIDNALLKLKEDGTYNQIYDHWFGGATTPG